MWTKARADRRRFHNPGRDRYDAAETEFLGGG